MPVVLKSVFLVEFVRRLSVGKDPFDLGITQDGRKIISCDISDGTVGTALYIA